MESTSRLTDGDIHDSKKQRWRSGSRGEIKAICSNELAERAIVVESFSLVKNTKPRSIFTKKKLLHNMG